MDTARTMVMRWRLTALIYVCCSLYLLFQGGKSSFMIFCMVNVLILYLVLGRYSGIAHVKGSRSISGVGGSNDNVLTSGTRLDVKLAVRIPGFWPIPYVLVHDRLQRQNGQSMQFESSFVPDMKRMGTVRYSTPPLQRGRYTFTSSECVTRDIFGLFEHKGTFQSELSFTVLPQTVPIRNWSLLRYGLRGPYANAAVSRSAKETTQLNGVRDYHYGDRLSRVHWNATAKTGEWKSKEFERESVPRTVVVLDRCAAAYNSAEQFELAVSAAASLFEYGMRRETAMGLVSLGATADGYQPRSNTDQRKAIMNHLVIVQADGQAGLYRSLREASAMLPSGSSVILVTPQEGEEAIRSMQWLDRTGMTPVMLHVRGSDPVSRRGQQEWQQMLRLRGWPVYQIRQLQELPAVLEGGAV
ncbi:DUF58 domain-containing protein [Paenibacillus sambharensis]|uniref:DUF58 domain-containing protein n=1 Tax=Paenibacillus sambharensis TaxID=1803190 RepID=A0A2W1LG51_9BACL|nr:DUF58 domain-containing protein [Paenibacillus sambharensis]PZD93985.1 DUF58 domain-containing protein [Paenibacillus sambharensis]